MLNGATEWGTAVPCSNLSAEWESAASKAHARRKRTANKPSVVIRQITYVAWHITETVLQYGETDRRRSLSAGAAKMAIFFFFNLVTFVTLFN